MTASTAIPEKVGRVDPSTPWPIVPLGELAADERNAITDGPFGSKLKTEHYVAAGPRVVRLTNIGDGEFIDAKAHIAEAHFATLQKHRVFPGDLVIAALGENPPRSCLVPEALGPAIVKADCIRFKAGPRILPKFLNYVLNGPDLRRHAKAIVHGVGRPRLNLGEIKALPIPVPPLPEQRRIVAEIEKQFTRLDAGIAALRRTQANLKRYRAAVLKAACEGRLVPTEAELAKQQSGKRGSISQKSTTLDFESGAMLLECILTERRKNWRGRGKYPEPTAPDTDSLPKLAEGWTWASLDQLLSMMRNGISAKPDAESGLPILRISAVRALSVNLTEIRFLNAKAGDYPDYALNQGDILFTRYNGNPELVGVCGVVPALTTPLVHPDKLIRCKLVLSGVLPDFVAIMANVGASRAYLAKRVRTTAGQAGISGGDLKGLPIPLAPIAEQTRIVAEVERRLSVVEELETVVNANVQRATRLRQSILQQAFSGKLAAE